VNVGNIAAGLDRLSILVVGAAAVLALVMSVVLSDLLTRTFLKWEGEATASLVRHHVRLAGLDGLFVAPREPASQMRWGQALPELVVSLPEIVRCRVWDREGAMLWSDNGAEPGGSVTGSPGLRAALAGEVVAQFKEATVTGRVPEFALVVDVHVPILAKDGTELLGVLEFYKRPLRLQASLKWGLLAIWAVALAGGAGLAFVAVPLARRAHARRSPANSQRPASAILAEVQRRFGFVPPFFEPAIAAPAVLESLWQQTISAYVDNPLPGLFKERLFAYLSRYCAVPYCIVCHSCALRPLGMAAADVLTLLESPPPDETAVAGQLAALADERGPLPAWPEPGSPLDTTLETCAILMFLRPDAAEPCQAEVRRLLGGELYSHLAGFLGYVKTCFTWVETHPELAYEADQRARDHLGPLLEQEPRLLEFFGTYTERVKRERRSREGGAG
jgi:hypothetical protein